MTYLEQIEQLSDKALALTEEDTEKRAFLLVAIDDPKEEEEANTMVVTAGTRENVQELLEVLLGVDDLAPLILNILVREQERDFDINDLLNELKNEN